MVRGKKTNGSVMLLLFLGVAIVNAAPTTSKDSRDFAEYTRYLNSDVFPRVEQEMSRINVLSNSYLSTISKEFHKQPVRFSGLPANELEVKSLPPAPGAFLMVVIGFLCVSLVKDRRIWLAALAGLLWAGQAGFSLLPQLTSNNDGNGRSVKQSSSCSDDYLYKPSNPFRLRSHIEGTSYIGLLYHLAGIPDASTSLIHRISVRYKLRKGPGRKPLYLYRRFGFPGKLLISYYLHKEKHYSAKLLHFAITTISSCLTQSTDCFVSKAERHSYFFNAFIIVNLARGPPDMNRTGIDEQERDQF